MASIFLMISLVNSEHLAEPPRSPVIIFPSFMTWNMTMGLLSCMISKHCCQWNILFSLGSKYALKSPKNANSAKNSFFYQGVQDPNLHFSDSVLVIIYMYLTAVYDLSFKGHCCVPTFLDGLIYTFKASNYSHIFALKKILFMRCLSAC